MIIDKETLVSDAQAITADAQSTDLYDSGSVKPARGKSLEVLCQVVEAFDNLTNLKITLQSSADAAFTTPVNHQSRTPLLADLTLGKDIDLGGVPNDALRFLRLDYDVTGSAPTVGKIDGGFIEDKQTNGTV